MAFEALAQTGNAIGGTLFGANESRKARDWAQRMAETVYQRTVKDLEKADLNPILAMRLGGNATPPVPYGAPFHSGAGAAGVDLEDVHTARNLITKKDKAVAEVHATNAQANATIRQGELAEANAKKVAQETKLLKYQEEMAKAEAQWAKTAGGWAPAARTIAPLLNLVPGIGTAKGLYDIYDRSRTIGTQTWEESGDGYKVRTTAPMRRRR